MTIDAANRPQSRYRPAMAWFAAVGSAWVFVLVMLGAFTTSYNVGMIFPDWPLSNGSLNPQGWLKNLAMFLEHSHRLSAGMMSIITIAIAVWIWFREDISGTPRRWLQTLAVAAVALILVQAVVGGLRVLLEHQHVAMINTSVGRLFAMLHACLAQIYVCVLVAIATAVSRPWLEGRLGISGDVDPALRRLGRWCCGLLLSQLAIAAIMRHSFAGLAIRTFPLSTPEGDLLPAAWDFRVAIHFTHRVMALVITVALISFATKIWRDRVLGLGLKQFAAIMVALLVLQIALGAVSVWTQRDPHYTTAHVIVGATTLAITFLITWLLHRDCVEENHRSQKSADHARATPASKWART